MNQEVLHEGDTHLVSAAQELLTDFNLVMSTGNEVTVSAPTKEPSKSGHALLPIADLETIQEMRIRLIGWRDNAFSRGQLNDDIRDFQTLEKQQVEWLVQLRDKSNRHERRGDDGLTVQQRAALKRFQNEGGHAFPLSKKTIHKVNRNGIILLAEIPNTLDSATAKSQSEGFITVGSITALSESPCTKGGSYSKDWPQFDLRDAVHEKQLEQTLDDCQKRIVLWRTTVRNDMRRLGIGACLKDVLFRFSLLNDKLKFTFNIGAPYNGNDTAGSEQLAANDPSLKHNDYAPDWGMRRKYATPLAPQDSIFMLWRAYHGKLDDALRAFEGEGGILKDKGILDIVGVDMQADAQRIFTQVQQEEGRGMRDRPWNKKED